MTKPYATAKLRRTKNDGHTNRDGSPYWDLNHVGAGWLGVWVRADWFPGNGFVLFDLRVPTSPPRLRTWRARRERRFVWRFSRVRH